METCRLKFWLFTVLFGMVFNFSLYAQTTVTGTVTDEFGNAISGVSVLVVGTTVGTTTGDDGTYTIAVPDANAVLSFSFVGYSSQEITVGTQRVIDVVLQGAATELEEAVIVGYGTQQQASVVAAISRSEEGRVGQEGVRTCRTRGSP